MWSDWLVFCDCGFLSVCPLMEKDKRLMEASWWERLTEGEAGSCSETYSETPILWPPDVKNWLIWKQPDAGKDWRWEEKGMRMTEDEIVGWHHRLNGHEFEWAPGVSDGQRGLVCCSPWGHKESDMTEWLNWIELKKEIDSVTSVLAQTLHCSVISKTVISASAMK